VCYCIRVFILLHQLYLLALWPLLTLVFCIDVDMILSLASLLLTCADLCGFELEKPASFKRPVFFFGCGLCTPLACELICK